MMDCEKKNASRPDACTGLALLFSPPACARVVRSHAHTHARMHTCVCSCTDDVNAAFEADTVPRHNVALRPCRHRRPRLLAEVEFVDLRAQVRACVLKCVRAC